MAFSLPTSTDWVFKQGQTMGDGSNALPDTWAENQSINFTPWHLSQDSYYEIQRLNNFSLVIGPPQADGIDTLGDEFTLCVESCPLPNISTNPIELSYMNSKVKVAGDATFEDISLTVKDVIDNDMEMRLWYWRRQVYNPQTGKVGWAKAYKRNGVIHQYGPNGECDRTWEVIGIWPTSMELGELSYESADKKQISMTLSVDFAYPGVRNIRVGRYGTSDAGKLDSDVSENTQPGSYNSPTGHTGYLYAGNRVGGSGSSFSSSRGAANSVPIIGGGGGTSSPNP